MDVFEHYSDHATEDSQASQLIQNVLCGGGTESGRRESDTNCATGDHKELSVDSPGSSIRNSGSAPRYHYHGLAVTQTQSQHYDSCGENGGSQKENINILNMPGEIRPMLPPTTNPHQPSPYASSSRIPIKEQPPHGGHSSHSPSRATTKNSKTMATATMPTSIHSSRVTASTSNNINNDVALDKPLPTRAIPQPATRLQTVHESSQDSFAGPVSQDPEREFLAASKQFEVPLSELGRVSYSQESQNTALPDQSPQHRTDMFVFPSRRNGVPGTPARLTSLYDHGRVLVAETPSNSGSSQSQPSQQWQQQFGHLESPDPDLFSNRQPMDVDDELVNGDVDARSEASTQAYDSTPSSSYERLLAGEPEPVEKGIEQYQATQPSTQPDGVGDHDENMGVDDADNSTTSGHKAEWGTSATRNTHTTASDQRHRQWPSQAAPAPSDNSSAVPRSIRSLVDPRKKWRLHKHEGKMAAPPLHTSGNEDEAINVTSETQPSFESGVESSGGRATAGLRPQSRHEVAWPPRKRTFPPSNDTMDIVPDSEPPQGEHESITMNAQSKESHVNESAFAVKAPLKRTSPQVPPAAESGEIVPDSVVMADGDIDDDDDDTPLATLAPKRGPAPNSGRGKAKKVVQTATGRKPLEMVPDPLVGKIKDAAVTKEKAIAQGKQKRNASATREPPQVDVDTTVQDMHKQPIPEAGSPVAEEHPAKSVPLPGRSWETGEVPSSVPEQDLNTTVSDPRVNANTQKVAKSKGKQAAKPVSSTPDRKIRSRSASSNPAKKRRISHDTDSSDDEADFIPKMKKEEEEETEPANEDDNYMDVDEAETSSRKRKRGKGKGKTNPKKPKSVSRVSTRASKNSETTPVRESKRLRSATSAASSRGASGLVTKVFALWKQDGHYYSGYVHSLVSGTRYLVKFDDGMDDEVDILRMRLNGLRVGDVVLMNAHEKAKVVDIENVESAKVVGVEVHDGEGPVRMDVKLCDIRIATRTISSQWKDRVLTTEVIVTTVKPKSLKHTPSLSKLSVVSSTSTRAVRSKALSKVGIAVTLSPGHNNWEVAKEKLLSTINSHGGTVIDDWFTIIHMDGTYTNNNKRWVIKDDEVEWAGNESLQRIFLLADDASQKSKYLIALALGIPCLAVNWLYDYVDAGETDWQPYLLPQGCSAALEARVSQFVDLDWCNSPEHLNKIMDNKVASKVFRNKSILCLSADFIPYKPKKTVSEAAKAKEAWSAVPRVALAMGASRVEAAADVKSASEKLKVYDYVVIKDASELKPYLKEEGVKCVSFQWVKECLIAGQLLPLPVW